MRRPVVALGIAALTAGVLGLGGCGSSESSSSAAAGPAEVHVTLKDYKLTLDRTSVPAGPVRFLIDNDGGVLHEVVLEKAGVDDEPFEVDGEESELEDISPGTKSADLEWTILTPGRYQLACHVTEGLDHYKHGMVSTFTVT